ncbi:MAG: cell surface protein SprA [Bacteroidota bacterium]
MVNTLKYILSILSFVAVVSIVWLSSANIGNQIPDRRFLPDPPDSLPYPYNSNDPFSDKNNRPIFFPNPKNISTDVQYDPASNQYIFSNKIGDSMSYGNPTYMDFNDYLTYDLDKAMKDYWKERTASTSLGQGKGGVIPTINIGGQVFDKIFGSSTIDIRPQGSAELIFGLNASRRDDPALDEKQRKTQNFDFQEKIQLNVTAKIGDKIQLGANYNTEASFDFDNKMKLQYEGKEDEIIKKIEAGDVTLPLSGSLITGSQALFGLKTQLQFGKTTVTSVLSQQKSKSSTIEVTGGAQKNYYELKADQYDENRHFFVAQYFRNHYEEALSKLPMVSTPINISKIEVWVTSIGSAINESRNIIAFQDLGENNPYSPKLTPTYGKEAPQNESNSLYLDIKDNPSVRNINTSNAVLTSSTFNFVGGVDMEKVEYARRLSPNEYTFNSKLGFISLNSSLNSDEVLAVAYQYTLIGDTTSYQVGEFSNGPISAPNALYVKLLKSTALDPKLPMWDLMMKNVYAIGAYQVNNQDFKLNILYANDENGVPTGYISQGAISGQSLINVFNLDNLNTQLDPVSDGVFDFIDGAQTNGGTINATNGKIFFPVLEPFGQYISDKMGDPQLAEKYSFKMLYDSTKSTAQQYPEKNKFYLSGSYKSSVSSEISMNAMNVPQGSVTVTSGGIKLTENVDYTVDYALGRVKIINEGIMNSGNPIRISLESNEMFNMQTKTLIGIHVDHKVSNDFRLGATMLKLTEKPMTQKINIGEDPISNTIWGVDGTYQMESRFVTKMVDFLPFIETKEKSNFTIDGEFAQLIPGHSRAIGKTGTSYIDDFEGSKSAIDLKNIGAWKLASTPQGQTEAGMFPEAAPGTGLKYGFNRARLAWYTIDRLFNDFTSSTPSHIKNNVEEQSNHYVRSIMETEVFPNADSPNNQPVRLSVLNLAFYPEERGMYNYDVKATSVSKGINQNGLLENPATRWGGIMRKIETTDFEATNVEYIEFWLMDPFAYSGINGNPVHSGGDMYINLGDISEDILRDSRKSFENGLPKDALVVNVDTTIWGRVPTLQALVNTFDNDPNSREFQDVGLDGLSNTDESSFFADTYLNKLASAFGTSSQAYQNAANDPSGDDYHYYQGSDYDSQSVGILNRYKNFNGLDGNSPTSDQSPESYPTQATTMPDIEDINRDNTLSEAERYFQYRIKLNPNEMGVGQNYITDILEAPVKLKNGNNSSVKWYQFKVPINSPEKRIGSISDFKSIRFMRIFLKNFQDTVVLRFATMELVRSEWRKYNTSLMQPGEYIPNDNLGDTQFEVSAVNIEENGKRTPIPYTLPPQIEREIAFGTTSLTRMNEQSLVLKTCRLQDGDARAVYKTTDFDIRQYKKLKMFVHAEAASNTDIINNGDLTVFIRLGTDFNNNYYEYEVPLALTPWGSSTDVDIWSASNMIDLDLLKLQDVKQQRNIDMRQENSTISINQPYTLADGNNKITVVGAPNISAVKTIMIGIRNPKQQSLTGVDDGLPKCAEIWVNELRLSDFDEKGGWAANARVSGNLADLGSVSLAGHVSTPGFGGIEQKLDQRSKENILQYDFITALELGKFFPEKVGLRIPLHFDFSEAFSNPEYYPMDPDVKYTDAINSFENKADRDSVKHISQDYTKRKSINFVNVKKNKTNTSSKPKIYDISNFDVTYAYTELYKRNIEIEYNMQKTYRGGLGYSFSNNPKNYEPFKSIKFLNKKALRIVKDFNFYLSPKLLSFRTDLDRQYSEQLVRNTSAAKLIIEPTYLKNFTWNRIYTLKFDLTKSLKLELTANNNARVDEPYGRIDKEDDDYKEKRKEIMDNISSFGRTTTYNHDINVNYTLPINKIPIINWVTVSARYSAQYRWQAAPLSALELGNTIENSNSKQLNGQFNMVTLYNKVGYLKKLNQPKPEAKKKTAYEIASDTTKKEEKEKVNYGKLALESTVKLLMSVKNASFTYTQTNGTFLPGYIPKTSIMGQDSKFQAPGTPFILGWQDENFAEYAGRNRWISQDSNLNTAFATRYAENISARVSVEPFKDFKIDITANRNFTRNNQKYYKYVDSTDRYESFSPTENGNFTMSTMAWKTMFTKDDKTTHVSEVFQNFKDNRVIIANRLAAENPEWGEYINDDFKDTVTGIIYPQGYGPTSQEVLIPAFLAAYTGTSASKIKLTAFPAIPLPNWRVTYNGLTKLDFFKKYFKTFTLGHGYRCNYNVGSYVSNINFRDYDNDGYSAIREELGYKNIINKNEIGQISISEQFGPLINFDMTWLNSIMTKVEIKKSRDLALSLTNNQLTEVRGTEFVIGGGYRIKDVQIPIKSGGRVTRLKSDVNIITNVSVRTNKTVLRKLVEDVNQVSSGQRIISINTSVDYQINQRFNIRLFFDKIINNPFVSSQFPNSNTNAGISLRFSLAQ